MAKIKYFIACLYINCFGETDVTYYAYIPGPYGMHKTCDYNDPNICYYPTKEEAKRRVMNATGECVMWRLADEEKAVQ